jgi:hypothetical protein
VIAVFELATFAITGYGPLRVGHENLGVFWLLTLLRVALVTPLISALHMHAVLRIGEGQRPRLGAVARRGIQVLPVVAAVQVMSDLGIALGFLALIIPGVILTLRWAVVAQVAAIEDRGWLAALEGSRRLTAENYWHIFGLQLLLGVLSEALHLGARAIPLGGSSSAASVTVGIVLETVVASFFALALALLYFDLRARSTTPGAQRKLREYPHLRDLD